MCLILHAFDVIFFDIKADCYHVLFEFLGRPKKNKKSSDQNEGLSVTFFIQHQVLFFHA